jgi:hypothetical protein
MIADGLLCGVRPRTPDVRWLHARGGPLWCRRFLPRAFLLGGAAAALVALALSAGVVRAFAQQWLVAVFAAAFAVVFLSLGVVPLVLRRRRMNRRTWLVMHGRLVDTEFAGIGRAAYSIWGDAYPHRIYSKWRDPRNGREYEFHSADLWVEPSAWLPRGAIQVRIDPWNPSRYEMDLAFVPAEVREG